MSNANPADHEEIMRLDPMSFAISQQCLELGLRARVILFRGVQVGLNDPALRQEIAQEAQAIQARFPRAEDIRSTESVVAFQQILRQVGVNPRKEKPSLERLLNFAHKKGDLPAINNLVDAYNLISVQSGCSLGAHDLDRITLPVTLRFLTTQDRFTPLGSDQPAPVNPEEFGYVDAVGRVLCRLDILQADFSKVTTSTRNVFLIVEGTTWHTQEMLAMAIDQVQQTITRYCGGRAEVLYS
jgi:DNA/RNA-binding domain of Phe-tRNA-synthetase-like protein